MTPRIPLVGGVATLWWLTLPGAITLHAQQPSPTPAVDALDRLQTALQAADRDAKKQSAGDAETATRRGGQRSDEFPDFMQSIREAMAREDDTTAISYLTRVQSAADSEELRAACTAVIAQIRKNRAEHETAYAAKVDDALKRAGASVLAAKTPKDLDAMLQELGRLGEPRTNRYNDGGMNNITVRIQAAVTFLNRWQDYLFAMVRDDEQSASNSLRNLAENNNGYNQPPLIPRSEILARMPANHGLNGETRERRRTSQADVDTAAEDILNHAQTLADIPAALAKLNTLRADSGDNQSSFNYGSAFSSVQTALQNFEKTRLELESGLGTTINLTQSRTDTSNQRPGIEARLVTLRAQLILLALPRLLNVPDERPVAGEGVDVFLRRLIEAAKKRGDWAAVVRGLELARTLASGANGYASSNSQENEAFKQFFTGLNMEAAGQFQQAVIAYLTALKTGVQDLPATLIGEHLASIQKEHAADYTAANTYVLSPPVSPYQNSPYGARGVGDPRLDPRFNRAGYPSQSEQPSPSVITVPAATPAPKSKAETTATPAPKPTP